MTWRSKIARFIGQIVYYILKILDLGGSSLPGKIALMISPNIVDEMSDYYNVIIVTGTNGKTLTTAMIYETFKAAGHYPITNSSGSNMLQGIATTFIMAKNPHYNEPFAILEVDEGSLKHVVPRVKPIAFVVNNIFEDQLDRYGSTENIKKMIREAIDSCEETLVVANGDQPILYDISHKHPVVYFGSDLNKFDEEKTIGVSCPRCGRELIYFSNAYADIGDYYCPNCQLKRPIPKYTLNRIVEMHEGYSEFVMDEWRFFTNLNGIYNTFNAIATYAIAKEFDIEISFIQDGFNAVENISGRQEVIDVYGAETTLNLAKNKVGLELILEVIAQEKESFVLGIAMNNKGADGEDPSWLKEVDWSPLKDLPIEKIYVAGTLDKLLIDCLAKYDLEAESQGVLVDFSIKISNSESQKAYVIASYTALTEMKKTMPKNKES